MSIFGKPSAGEFFRPAHHMNDLALLIETKSIRRNVPNTYQGVTSTRDEVVADITIFSTSESLDKGQPSKVLKGATITHKYLTPDLEAFVDKPFLAIVTRKTFANGGSGFVWRGTDPSVEGKVENYFTSREEAVTRALANVPTFD
ncbi:hypothetical protein [Salinispora pacifica]|uniref:hypothetical protein n=1 Tax=Salinispora pacifica TaxID=351187 RepID=UPI00035FC974|nr:hypothetical protein [Salinispora pacifica]